MFLNSVYVEIWLTVVGQGNMEANNVEVEDYVRMGRPAQMIGDIFHV